MLARLPLLLALAALVCASAVHAEGFENAPYMLADGTVVDPNDPASVARAANHSSDDIYMPLSRDGPMGGMGQPPQNPRGQGRSLGVKGRPQEQGIRSPHDGGDIPTV